MMIHLIKPVREIRHGRPMARGWCGTWHIVKTQGGQECPQCVRAQRRANGGK